MTNVDAPIPKPGRGGARPGAGRPPANKPGAPQSEDSKLYNASRARKETADANLKELEFKTRTRRYVSREAVIDASATMLSTIAQSLRSLPDRLERKGLEPKMCAVVSETIDSLLLDAAEELEMLVGAEPPPLDDAA